MLATVPGTAVKVASQAGDLPVSHSCRCFLPALCIVHGDDGRPTVSHQPRLLLLVGVLTGKAASQGPGGSQPGNESGRLPTPQPTGYPCVRLSRPQCRRSCANGAVPPDITYDPTQTMHTVWREVHVGANSPATSIVHADGGFVTLGIWTE